ncbi:hypothetical protein [Actinoplanes xinjiangensis]|uniref:Uncharacterized protein n=1 Tax=Actinoplanes xinjiangensis TaxID=512350 RepID=A0A316FF12_9ACTN|nr:hypothetical protein [Actinoplanes xinjiangensis]PWK47478.1 hypothetical protein BC793_10788 [Actinoplanes xinjiangensis]GIF39593.1 hypothetical protein Axi01nite_39040 [Actinoplanes xinjiangensis]
MRWFRFGAGRRQAERDPGRQQEIYRELRQRFGGHVPGRFADQAAEATRLLDGDDGIVVAAHLLREFADAAFAATAGQGFQADRRNYRWTWQGAGPRLRSPLAGGPGFSLHPYVHVAAAAAVVAGRAGQLVKVTAAEPVLTHVLEILDLITAGWEYGGVAPDADAANLASALIAAARELRAAMPDAPPLPSGIRDQMRRNNTVDVWDPAANRIVGGFNPGRAMREALLA